MFECCHHVTTHQLLEGADAAEMQVRVCIIIGLTQSVGGPLSMMLFNLASTISILSPAAEMSVESYIADCEPNPPICCAGWDMQCYVQVHPRGFLDSVCWTARQRVPSASLSR